MTPLRGSTMLFSVNHQQLKGIFAVYIRGIEVILMAVLLLRLSFRCHFYVKQVYPMTLRTAFQI